MADREFGENDLMVACAENNLEQVQALLLNGKPSVTAKDSRGRTALHYCSENIEEIDIAKLLIRSKKSLVKVKDKNDVQALHLAVIAGNEAFIELLLLNGADMKSTDKEKHSVIHLATAHGHPDLIDYLLDRGAMINKPDKANAFPLHYAVQLCAEKGADKTTAAAAPEKTKGKKGKAAAAVKEPAATNKGMEVLQRLLNRDVEYDCRDCEQRTPLIWAAGYGLRKVVDTLLHEGAGLEVSDQNGMTALHAATAKNQPDMIQFLISQCKADVNAVDKSGCTPLFLAVSLDFRRCVEVLIRYGANANHKDNKGRTVAHWAAVNNSEEMLTEILHAHGDLWVKNDLGNTPAYEAAVKKQNDAVLFLLDQAPDVVEAVNEGNEENITLLHVAAVTNNAGLCTKLLSCGARKDVMMNCSGKELSPHEVAVMRRHTEVAQVLETLPTGTPPEGMGHRGGHGAGGGATKKGGKDKKEKKGGKGKKKK